MKHHFKCITLWHGSLTEAVLFYDILPDPSANSNDYEDPFVTAYYNQCGVDMVQRALLPQGSKWKTWHLTPVYVLQFAH